MQTVTWLRFREFIQFKLYRGWRLQEAKDAWSTLLADVKVHKRYDKFGEIQVCVPAEI